MSGGKEVTGGEKEKSEREKEKWMKE